MHSFCSGLVSHPRVFLPDACSYMCNRCVILLKKQNVSNLAHCACCLAEVHICCRLKEGNNSSCHSNAELEQLKPQKQLKPTYYVGWQEIPKAEMSIEQDLLLIKVSWAWVKSQPTATCFLISDLATNICCKKTFMIFRINNKVGPQFYTMHKNYKHCFITTMMTYIGSNPLLLLGGMFDLSKGHHECQGCQHSCMEMLNVV